MPSTAPGPVPASSRSSSTTCQGGKPPGRRALPGWLLGSGHRNLGDSAPCRSGPRSRLCPGHRAAAQAVTLSGRRLLSPHGLGWGSAFPLAGAVCRVGTAAVHPCSQVAWALGHGSAQLSSLAEAEVTFVALLLCQTQDLPPHVASGLEAAHPRPPTSRPAPRCGPGAGAQRGA